MVDRDRWYPFAPGASLTLTLFDPAPHSGHDAGHHPGPDAPPDAVPRGRGRSVGAWACSIRADHILVMAPGAVPVGSPVVVPLETIRSGRVEQPGVVETCVPVAPGEHRTLIRFTRRIDPTDHPVCWGVAFEHDGGIVEIAAGQARAAGHTLPGRRPVPTDRARMERAANLVTVATELARRAGEGAGDAELRELVGLISVLLATERGDRAA